MPSLKSLLINCILTHLATSSHVDASGRSNCDARARPYSVWMADSIISRGQAILAPGAEPEAATFLKIGVFQDAILRLKQHYGSSEVCGQADWDEYLAASTESITPWLVNSSQNTQYPLDRFSDGRGLLYMYETTKNETYREALDALDQSVKAQPKNALGGYWYFKYPYWSYLDGMYSLIPFYDAYTKTFAAANHTSVSQDIIHQLDLLWSHCYQNDTGLLVHGYDASETAVWADAITGASPVVWGRSLGWYTITLVDVLEQTSALDILSREQWDHLHHRFIALSKSIIGAADPDTGCWWQVMNYPTRQGNYIESSGSAMFTYALYKGARLGYFGALSERGIHPARLADACYRNLTERFVDNHNGTLGYNGTVSVCSLNSTADYEYYVNQPLLYDSVHGSASFVLASLEHEMSTLADQEQ
ncbi:Six-hairpin glycosidase-like protein [Aspergillus avenaceus]|uniref:Six-hairpin glycosidase-like protein n=1 Tax=Aspergillus avenaceus TaxID=36643 RepID=A0A5N6U706_ASPAV|nr:Six-hairpin glycosidase-like protein [Aspergillus avenaceus]